MEKRIKGEIMSREAQKQRIQTLMGMRQQEASAFSREAQIAQAQAMEGIGDIAGGIGTIGAGFMKRPQTNTSPVSDTIDQGNNLYDPYGRSSTPTTVDIASGDPYDELEGY